MSKRNEPDNPTELASTGSGKKPRLDLEEQIKRASTLAAQLRDGVKDGTDSKTSAANQIATEGLMRIFESMQEKTVNTSKSVDDLIQAQIASEVKNALDFLKTIIKYDAQINFHRGSYSLLDPARPEYIPLLTSVVQKRMQGVTSGHYVAEIKKHIKEVIIDNYTRACSKQMEAILKIQK